MRYMKRLNDEFLMIISLIVVILVDDFTNRIICNIGLFLTLQDEIIGILVSTTDFILFRAADIPHVFRKGDSLKKRVIFTFFSLH